MTLSDEQTYEKIVKEMHKVTRALFLVAIAIGRLDLLEEVGFDIKLSIPEKKQKERDV